MSGQSAMDKTHLCQILHPRRHSTQQIHQLKNRQLTFVFLSREERKELAERKRKDIGVDRKVTRKRKEKGKRNKVRKKWKGSNGHLRGNEREKEKECSEREEKENGKIRKEHWKGNEQEKKGQWEMETVQNATLKHL